MKDRNKDIKDCAKMVIQQYAEMVDRRDMSHIPMWPKNSDYQHLYFYLESEIRPVDKRIFDREYDLLLVEYMGTEVN